VIVGGFVRVGRRAVGLLGMTALLSLTLSGCVVPIEPIDPMAVKMVNSRLNVVLCESPSFNELQISEVDKSSKPSRPQMVWRVTGRTVSTSSPIVFGVAPTGLNSVLGPSRLDLPGNRVTISASVRDSGGALIKDYFGIFDGDSISNSYWLNERNERVATPCP